MKDKEHEPFSQHMTYDTLMHKSLLIEKQENNAISVS